MRVRPLRTENSGPEGAVSSIAAFAARVRNAVVQGVRPRGPVSAFSSRSRGTSECPELAGRPRSGRCSQATAANSTADACPRLQPEAPGLFDPLAMSSPTSGAPQKRSLGAAGAYYAVLNGAGMATQQCPPLMLAHLTLVALQRQSHWSPVGRITGFFGYFRYLKGVGGLQCCSSKTLCPQRNKAWIVGAVSSPKREDLRVAACGSAFDPRSKSKA